MRTRRASEAECSDIVSRSSKKLASCLLGLSVFRNGGRQSRARGLRKQSVIFPSIGVYDPYLYHGKRLDRHGFFEATDFDLRHGDHRGSLRVPGQEAAKRPVREPFASRRKSHITQLVKSRHVRNRKRIRLFRKRAQTPRIGYC